MKPIKDFNHFMYAPTFSLWYTILIPMVVASHIKGEISAFELIVYVALIVLFEIFFSPILSEK